MLWERRFERDKAYTNTHTQTLKLTTFVPSSDKENMVKGKKTGKKKSGKSTSNVFSMFEQQQIQEFKEAFGMIDANRDGFIDKDDLRLFRGV